MRSPIERMIDEACGFDAKAALPSRLVWIQCPRCSKRRATRRAKTDPTGAATVIFPCPDCPPQEGYEVAYLDAEGRPLEAE